MPTHRTTLHHLLALIVLTFALPLAENNTARAGVSALPPEITISDNWLLQDAAKVKDQGQTISQPNYASDAWLHATVPGTVLTSLVNDGKYPEPLYGENNRPNIIPDSLCRTSYWYRTQFQIPSEFAGNHIWLNFHGINFIAEVWINGHDLGAIKGAFIRGIFDITSDVTPGQPATLAVQILPPPHPNNPNEHTVQTGTGPNGGILTIDGPTFLCTQGWDWIPGIRDRDMGIWQKVTLSASGPALIQDPSISSDLPLPRTDSADLTLTTTLRNVTADPQSGTLHAHFASAKLPGVDFDLPVTLAPRESKTLVLSPAQVPQLHVQNPQLWWPSGYGAPNLYNLQLTLALSGKISDAKAINFGIRKITYTVPGTDNLTVSVNGVPVMCKGGDWGMDEAMKRIPRDRLEAQIRYHQLANFNIIRNWVGQSTSEDFYDLCDEYGIMVWDEFFQPNKFDGPNVTDFDLYLANVRDKMLRFRSHPCIAIWCGRNESDPAPQEIDLGIQKIAAELDPARLYHRNSADGHGVKSAGPYHWRPPRDFYTFNCAFQTEIGSVSIPTIESIHAMMPQKDWETVNNDWAEHDLGHGAQEGTSGSNPLYPIAVAHRFGAIANLPDFVRKAQLANYEDFRALYEGRNAKLFNPCTGVITWMSNPAQPSFVWQIYAHDLEPLAALYAARKACEPVHVQMNQSDFHIMVINNTPAPIANLVVRERIYNLDSSLKSDRTIPLTAKPSVATDLGSIDAPADLSPVHFVRLDLGTADNHSISDNFYWQANPDHEDDYTALDSMPAASLTASITRRDDAGNSHFEVTLTNPGATIALMAHLQLRNKSGDRVLPVYYSDNYITLVPGESRTITVEAAADSTGDHPTFALDGWNITTTTQDFKDATLSLNQTAQINSLPTGKWKVVRPELHH